MRAPTDMPRRRPRLSRRRIWLIVGVLVVVILILSLRGIAVFYTDYLWFDSVNLSNVWKGTLGAKVGLALVFMALFFVAMLVSLTIADRLAPKFRPLGPEDELVQRYQDAVGKHARAVRIVASVVLAILIGVQASAHWKDWILFSNSVPFGVKDPQFHTDVSFFVFRLPFLSFLVSWLFIALLVIAIMTTIAHYLNGGIRFQGPGQRVSPQVKAHLSVLLGLMALDKAFGYWFQRFSLDTSTRGFVQGATYTDVHAQLPALTLLMWISIAAFVILVVNIWLRGWVLPIVGVGLWLFLSLVVGAIYPWFIQTFKVQPSQNTLERPYIARNITATRTAMGINNVQPSGFAANTSLTANQLTTDIPSLNSVRLWEPNFAEPTFERLQDIRSYYRFNELALDRYLVNGQLTPAIVAVRQLNTDQLPAQSWVNSHLQYTHGYGAVLSPANTATGDGNPQFAVGNLPPASSQGVPKITQPSVYFGLNANGYVIANTKQSEIDFQLPNGNTQSTHYTGAGDVAAGSLVRRAAFALRFGDINPLISGQVTSQSRVLFVRDIRDRVAKAAPFLQFDADPYPILLHGRIYWMQDAYTTTDRYPYGQTGDISAVNSGSGLNASFNYVRNSVKILIDAYNGNMTFYQMDPHDPIIRAYSKAFPGMFVPASSMDAELRAHLRYPEDIFAVQAAMYGRYHITNAANFYGASDAWNISQSPGEGSPSAALSTTASTNAQGNQVGPTRTTRMSPIYQVMTIPSESNPTFNILEAFVPVSQNDQNQILSAFMVAESDPGHYGRMKVFVTPRGTQVDGPALIDARISAVPQISQTISLLNQQGSSVVLGNVLMVPVENGILYIRPLYVSSSRTNLPQFKYVIVVYGNNAAMDTNLPNAIAKVFGTAVPGFGGAPSAPSSTGAPAPSSGGAASNANVRNLLSQAQNAYNQAQAALGSGNLGQYQADVNQMDSLLNQAFQAAQGGSSSSTTTPSTGTNGATGTSGAAGLSPTTTPNNSA